VIPRICVFMLFSFISFSSCDMWKTCACMQAHRRVITHWLVWLQCFAWSDPN
jgi:hypothetical protein